MRPRAKLTSYVWPVRQQKSLLSMRAPPVVPAHCFGSPAGDLYGLLSGSSFAGGRYWKSPTLKKYSGVGTLPGLDARCEGGRSRWRRRRLLRLAVALWWTACSRCARRPMAGGGSSRSGRRATAPWSSGAPVSLIYFLRLDGYPAGQAELPAKPPTLLGVRIEAPAERGPRRQLSDPRRAASVSDSRLGADVARAAPGCRGRDTVASRCRMS